MPKYMIQGSFTREGIQGLLKEGGSSRKETLGKMLGDLGGSLESFYFAFGADDVILIVELPDNATAAAVGMAVSATGAVGTRTTVLLTPEEVDTATHTSVGYRAPGA